MGGLHTSAEAEASLSEDCVQAMGDIALGCSNVSVLVGVSPGWYMMASGGGLKRCGCSGEYISASMSMVLHILCISNLLKRFSS